MTTINRCEWATEQGRRTGHWQQCHGMRYVCIICCSGIAEAVATLKLQHHLVVGLSTRCCQQWVTHKANNQCGNSNAMIKIWKQQSIGGNGWERLEMQENSDPGVEAAVSQCVAAALHQLLLRRHRRCCQQWPLALL